jgi:hypothetical protein
MSKITVTDVRVVFSRYVATLQGIGVDVSKIELQEGSYTNGRAFRVTRDGFDAPGTGDRGFIGLTARDAYDTLWTIVRTLDFAQTLGL